MTLSVPTFQMKGDPSPSPQRLGLTIQPEQGTPVEAGETQWISGVLALSPEVFTPDSYGQWMRSLFVAVTSLKNQRAYCCNLLKDQMVFSDDIVPGLLADGQAVNLSRFRFELLDGLNRSLPPETYFIEVSARQYRSNILMLDVA